MKKIFSILTLATMALTACNKKPSVSFSASTTEPEIDEAVTFSNSSSGAVRYTWQFGDGETSTEQSPKHKYAIEGVYEVTLKAYSKNNHTWEQHTEVITVKHPASLFSGNISGTEVKLYAGVNDVVSAYDVIKSVSGGNRSIIYKAWLRNPATDEKMGIDFGTLVVPDNLTLTQISPFFHSMIKVEDDSYYQWSVGAASGIRIYYEAPNGIVWSTDAGTGNQSGSNFVVTFTEDRTGPDRERIKARFNCKLYDGLGNTKTVTNGLFELDFANI